MIASIVRIVVAPKAIVTRTTPVRGRTQQPLIDEKFRGLPGEDLVQPRFVKRAHPPEDIRLVKSALGHQKMQAGVEIDPVPERLDDGDNTGLECLPSRGPIIFEVLILGMRIISRGS
jgi:hypothetical protein